jgi:hypothetical protein
VRDLVLVAGGAAAGGVLGYLIGWLEQRSQRQQARRQRRARSQRERLVEVVPRVTAVGMASHQHWTALRDDWTEGSEWAPTTVDTVWGERLDEERLALLALLPKIGDARVAALLQQLLETVADLGGTDDPDAGEAVCNRIDGITWQIIERVKVVLPSLH